MRRILLAFAVLLSACATAPEQPQPQPVSAEPDRGEPRGLIGLSAAELVQHLGSPALQIREGTSVKLQFRNTRCVLDAYLYPQSATQLRVAHIDTRTPSGADTNQAACVATFESAG